MNERLNHIIIEPTFLFLEKSWVQNKIVEGEPIPYVLFRGRLQWFIFLIFQALAP